MPQRAFEAMVSASFLRLLAAIGLLWAMLSAHSAAVAGEDESRCSVTGAKLLAEDASSDYLCRRFMQHLEEAVDGSRSAPNLNDLSVAIALSRPGSVQARVTALGAGTAAREYPLMTVDVMDRSLELRDLDRLAEAVGRMLAGE